MTRSYSLVMESGPLGISAYIPELPSILITGSSIEEVRSRAADAIRLYWETLNLERSPSSILTEIQVELPV